MNSSTDKRLYLRIYFLLAILEGIVVFVYLALIPSDSKNALYLGYSASRLALMGGVVLALLVLGGIFAGSSYSTSTSQRISELLDRLLVGRKSQIPLTLLFVLIVLTGTALLLLPAEAWGDMVDQFDRVAPLVSWISALSFQSLVIQFFWFGGVLNWKCLAEWKPTLRIALISGCLLAIVSGLVIWSRIGIEPDRSGWYAPGTPLLILQVFFSWVIGLGMIAWGGTLEGWFGRITRKAKLDFVICLALWFAALLIWSVEPMQKYAYFSQEPTPPNFEYYPYSDARLYDETSQNILIGTARNFRLILRPLYTFSLALLHFLGGQQFDRVILLQITVLAVIPVLIFKLASRMSNRPAGMIAAVLIILREKNSISLSNVIEVSHTKLLLTDVPAMALMCLFILFLVNWLASIDQKGHLGVAAGASLGLVILIRSQAQLLIPVVLLGIIFVLKFQRRRILQSALIFLLGVIVVAGPWVWRNYQISGRLVVENTEHYIEFFASSYHTDDQSVAALPGESIDDYYQRMRNQVIDFVIQHPGEVAHFYASHFVHNEIESVVYLPMSLWLYDTRSYVKEMGFWNSLQIGLSTGSVILFFVSLGLIAVGIGAAVNRLGILGLAPLLIHLSYSLTIVPVRLSGWRFILPMDWISLLYYSIGLAQLTAMGLAILSKRYAGPGTELRGVDRDVEYATGQGNDRRKTILVLTAFLIIGLSLPLVARFAPERYPEIPPHEIIGRFSPERLVFGDGTEISLSDLISFIAADERAVLTYGRALYPSYYEQGVYWGDDNPYNLDMRDYTRVQFNLIGPVRAGAFLPLASPPDAFPHASDVVVVGCWTASGNSVRVLVAIVNHEIVLNASPWNGLTCEEIRQ
jgi:hypothetical protein